MVHNERPAGRRGLHTVEDGIAKPSGAMSMTGLLAAITQMRAAEVEEPSVGPEDTAEEANAPMTMEELLAAISGGSNTGRNPRTGKFVPRRQPKPQSAAQVAARGPRKCANCGKTHVERECPHPAIARDDRLCWTCGKKNHSSRDCPDKPKAVGGRPGGPLKAIEDLIKGMPAFAVTDENDG
jgi:hypothetical protein